MPPPIESADPLLAAHSEDSTVSLRFAVSGEAMGILIVALGPVANSCDSDHTVP
jgi:hypothetical protein